MPTPTPVVAIPIVDTSGSMSYSGYVAITVIDTKAFLSNALAGDYIGVASYDTSGRVTYNLTLVDQALTVPQAAANAVQNLSFMGNCTNMGSGLQTGVSMLAKAPAGVNKGLVLLSDGYQNCGTSPLPLPAGTPRVYSCAMGPNSDQTLMRNIATQSGGTYYYAPYVYNMMQIYNQIRAQAPASQLLVNAYKNATPYDSLLIPATISAGNDLGQFSVVWSDASIPYVNGQPGLNQISVTLVNPSGQVLTPSPSLQGGGYVVFNIPNPPTGLWYIQIEYGGDKPQGLTGGAFEFSPSGKAALIHMSVEAPEVAKAGASIPIAVNLEEDGTPMQGHVIHATLTKPKISVRNALVAYAHMLKGIALPDNVADACPKDKLDVAKLAVLHNTHMPTMDLLPHVKSSSFLTHGKDGKYSMVIPDTLEAGTYNLQFEVTGVSSKSGTAFSRSHLVSILVND